MLHTAHPIRAARKPDGSAPLFSFAVVADTHVNERDDSSSSPFETNRAANDRARHVFRDIAAMDPQPAFIVHLGDIVHPVPSVPTFHEAVSRFKDIAAQASAPLHVLPGNHDVGDKKVEWMPADQVCDAYLRTYREAFGPDYYAFDHGPVRFVAINSLLLNSGLPDEQRQREWLERQVAEGGKRVVLFMHYPPYIHAENERGSYDNVDQPARAWLLELMRRPQVEAVFAGHVHNFWYDRVGSADFYMLPSTAFLRHDFTEFYRVAPAQEFGRGDVEKFGYFVVDVYADGHVAYSVRTHGQKAAAGSLSTPPAPVHLAHPATSGFDRVGVELRHPWAETLQISATGGVQEFGRKWARNDYPLLALWEMGARLAKVPDQDVAEPSARARMELMARMGQRYIVTCLGRPRLELPPQALRAAGIEAVEVNATLATFERQQGALREWRQTSGTQVYFSKIHTFDDSHFDGQHFSHFVKAGLTLQELERSVALVGKAVEAGTIDGVTVRIEPEDDLLDAARRLEAFCAQTGAQVLASLKTSGPNLATERADDRALVQRVAQAMLLSRGSDRVCYVFDTFMDVDRGYYPRHGFIDRRFDPRPAALSFTLLASLLGPGALEVEGAPTGDVVRVRSGGRSFELHWGTSEAMRDRARDSRCHTVYDLVEGSRQERAAFASALSGQPDPALLHVLLFEFGC
jgi:3',5'-cyclic AMP phosphodiesterase CpdA